MELLAIVGRQGSGKDTAAKYIAENYGFLHVSSGDVLRDYIRKNSLGSIERKNLQRVVTELRKTRGNDILIRLILTTPPSKRIIISGLRHPDEIALIKEYHGKVLAVETDIEVRYKYAVTRNREGDDISFAEFARLESKENTGGIWNINQVIEDADEVVTNNSSLKAFQINLDVALSNLGIIKLRNIGR